MTNDQAQGYVLLACKELGIGREQAEQHRIAEETSKDKLPKDIHLDYILARFSHRVVQKGHALKYQNKLYHLYNQNQHVLLAPKTKLMIIHTKENQLYASHQDSLFMLKEIPLHEKVSKEFDKPIERKKMQVHIPPMSHPWKKASYDRYLRKKNQKEALKTNSRT